MQDATAICTTTGATAPGFSSGRDTKLYTFRDPRETYRISRTRAYELLSAGRITAVKLGHRTMLTAESLDAYVRSLPPASIRPAKAAA